MKRKEFIRHSVAAGALIGAGALPFDVFASAGIQKLTILHTNDQHSRIEPFPLDGGKYQGLGGFSQRAEMIKQIRETEKNVLLLDSGDIWQGTPYFNKYLGELEFKLMSEMKYDASTLGNHDFDAGLDGLVKQLPLAKFPFLNVNYDFSDSPLSGKVQRHKIFQFNDIKVGVFGVGIELEGLVPADLFGGVRYNDPILNANKAAEELKHDYKCDFIICLSHLGYKYDDKKVSDEVLARSTKNIDLILGGHTHTFLDKPVERTNMEGGKVLINQVGWAGIYLGRIDVFFERKKRAKLKLHSPRPVKCDTRK
jgi:5'-nucleotidase